MTAQLHIMNMLAEAGPGNTPLHDRGAEGERLARLERPELEPGSEEFYTFVLNYMLQVTNK